MSNAHRDPPATDALASREAGMDRQVLRAALAASDLGTFELDPQARTIRWDQHCRNVLGIAAESATLEGFLEHVHPDDRVRMRQSFAGLVARVPNEKTFCEEFRHRPRKDGVARRIEIRCGLVEASDRATLFGGILREVTEQRLLDEDRDQHTAELERTVLLSEMFVGVLAHDLRNPIAAVKMWAQLASKRATEPALGQTLRSVVMSSDRLARMVDQLLDFTAARVGSGIPLRIERFDLLTVTKQVIEELGVAHPEWKVQLEAVGVTAGSWDADRLAQVMSNLVGNALRHGLVEHGVRVHIDGSATDAVFVEVHNQGLIPPEIMPVVFQAFRGADHNRDRSRALGLGLYVTRQIALAHGGDVEVTSADPQGTTFRVRLPRAQGSPRFSLPSGAEDLAPLEQLATDPRTTAVTAQLFGAAPLEQRAPRAYQQIVDQYTVLLDEGLHRGVYKDAPDQVADSSVSLRAIADRLGVLNAGAREVAELHARVIRQRTQNLPVTRSQGLITEGRLMAFELMGHLLSFYRKRATINGPGDKTE